MNNSTKKFGWGHVAFGLMALTMLACGGGSGGTDRELERNFYALNAGYSGNAQRFAVSGINIAATSGSDFDLTHGSLSSGRAEFTNKQLDPIPFTVRNASDNVVITNSSQQTTSSDRHFLVSYGPDSAAKAVIIPLEPISGSQVVLDAAMLDDSETRVMDVYLLGTGHTLAGSTPIMEDLKYDPTTPQFMVQQEIMSAGGNYSLVLTLANTKTEVAEYTQSVTLTDKFFHLLTFTRDPGGRHMLFTEQKRAPG